MSLIVGVEAVLVFPVTKIARAPIGFLVLFSFIFQFWGEIYSLFSATTGDVFGHENASANYGLVYTAKGCGLRVRRIRTGNTGCVLRRLSCGALLYFGCTVCDRGNLLSIYHRS
jgi:MFS transporter, OFA family, oxalate/formate antiporter